MLLEINAIKFEEYIDSYKFVSSCKKTFSGFIKPKEEFEEWFGYIIKFYNLNSSYSNYNEMLDYHVTIPFEPYISGYIGWEDLFVFEFPDEETALYFKLKFNL